MMLWFSLALANTQAAGNTKTTFSQIITYFSDIIKENLIISFFASYFFGKFIEFLVNKFFKIGWRIIPYNVEIFNFIKFTTCSVIFSRSLDIFVKKTGDFINAVRERDERFLDNDKLIIYYHEENQGKENFTKICNKLKQNNLQKAVIFKTYNLDYPKNAFFGQRQQPVRLKFLQHLMPRFWRYKNKEYFSGLLTGAPFIPSTEKEIHDILKEYTYRAIENRQTKQPGS